MHDSKFIVLEGVNGSGKTTQSKILKDNLIKLGYDVILVNDPGSTPIGDAIRDIVKSSDYGELAPATQLMLYNAARAELVNNIIIPALADNKIVISDRYVTSTMAYQAAQGLHRYDIKNVCYIATNGIKPDLTVFLNMPVEKAIQRAVERNIDDPKLALGIEFHKDVSYCFEMEYKCRECKHPWLYVNADQDIEMVSKQIVEGVKEIL